MLHSKQLPSVDCKYFQHNLLISVCHSRLSIFSLLFMVPTACSIFPQHCSINMKTIERFESEAYEKMLKKTSGKLPEKVYFNKGL